MDTNLKSENKDNRSLYCWGFGKYGQVGREGINYSINPNKIIISDIDLSDEIFMINGGEFHNAILTANSKLYMFGKNSNGQLGLGDTLCTFSPSLLQLPNNRKVIKVACGGEHTLALTEEGNLFSWGLNIFGQLGLAHFSFKNTPNLVDLKLEEDEEINDIAAGAQHSVFSTNNNNIYSCGCGKTYALGNGKTDNLNVFTRIDEFNFNDEIDKLSCGVYHTACIIKKERVYLWGKGDILQYEKPTLINIYQNLSPTKNKRNEITYKDIKIGDDFVLLLTYNDDLFLMGSNKSGQLGCKNYISRKSFEKLDLNDKVKTIECGYNYIYAFTNSKKIYCWGNNKFGQLSLTDCSLCNEPKFLEKLSSFSPYKLSCGAYHLLAIFSKTIEQETNADNLFEAYNKIIKVGSLPKIIDGTNLNALKKQEF